MKVSSGHDDLMPTFMMLASRANVRGIKGMLYLYLASGFALNLYSLKHILIGLIGPAVGLP